MKFKVGDILVENFHARYIGTETLIPVAIVLENTSRRMIRVRYYYGNENPSTTAYIVPLSIMQLAPQSLLDAPRFGNLRHLVGT